MMNKSNENNSTAYTNNPGSVERRMLSKQQTQTETIKLVLEVPVFDVRPTIPGAGYELFVTTVEVSWRKYKDTEHGPGGVFIQVDSVVVHDLSDYTEAQAAAIAKYISNRAENGDYDRLIIEEL